MSRWLRVGATLAGAGVAAGAFGAHALEARIEPDLLEIFETGVRYQIYHALALVLVGVAELRTDPRTHDSPTGSPDRDLGSRERRLAWSGRLFTIGILIFSGSLYLLALTGQRWLGAVTPLGGLAFLLGWGSLAFAGLGRRPR
jgi:uncharacterized membrane protein YgdD (TMEM256/DUF423 family)